VTGLSYRFEAGDFEVRQEQPIQHTEGPSLRVGNGSDLDAPFYDGDKLYGLAALERSNEVYGWLYVYAPADFTEAEEARFAALGQFIAVVLQNIRLIEAAERLAYTDTLTNLPNRRAIENEMSRLVRVKRQFAYIMMDLDDFKKINDTRGHDAGDEALVRVAEALRAAARRNDYVGRLMGDEFVALIDGHETEQFMTRVSDMLHVHGIGTSHGVARFPDDAETLTELTKLGDDRLYEVKRERKSRRAVSGQPPI
jgi:diguanylate cyclase (GGDEF)-like protein